MTADTDLFPPTLADFVAMADAVLADLPDVFRARIGNVAIQVEDFADAETLAELDIDNPFQLTGLYHGAPLTEDSVSHPAPYPPQIFLYRQPILAEWAERGDVGLHALVAHVLIHEIAHHFGWSDEQMHALIGE